MRQHPPALRTDPDLSGDDARDLALAGFEVWERRASQNYGDNIRVVVTSSGAWSVQQAKPWDVICAGTETTVRRAAGLAERIALQLVLERCLAKHARDSASAATLTATRHAYRIRGRGPRRFELTGKLSWRISPWDKRFVAPKLLDLNHYRRETTT